MKQCNSCGGDCQESGCERTAVYLSQVPIEKYDKAVELAIYFRNRCRALQEIIEMFCMDAETQSTQETPTNECN